MVKEKIKKLVVEAVAILIIAGIILGVVLSTAFFGTLLMRFMGFEYTTIWGLFLFWLAFFIAEIPINLFSENFPSVLKKFNVISYKICIALQFMIKIILTILTILIIDNVNKEIFAPFASIIIFSILKSLLDIILSDKKLA